MLGNDANRRTLPQCIDNSHALKSRQPAGRVPVARGCRRIADWGRQVGPILLQQRLSWRT
jgi:hypothetical protein